MNTVEERRARWQQICQEYHESGETLKQFCESRGIARSTLGYWLNPARGTSPSYQKRKKHSGTNLVPVATVSIRKQSVLRLRIGEDLVAELELPSDESVIRSVLRAAQSI
jgi:transposase-like protein